MKNIAKWILLFSAISIAAVLAGCSDSSTGDNVAAQAYAQTTERMLQAINDGDYSKFSADFSAQMKQSLTESSFQTWAAEVKSKIGSYVANRVFGTQEQANYTEVTYKAKFSDEPDDVTVTVKFQKVGGTSLVSEFTLDSPGLQTR